MKVAALITLVASRVGEGRALASFHGLRHIDASLYELIKPRQVHAFIRSEAFESPYVFLLDSEGLSLVQHKEEDFLSIRADFHGASVRYRRDKGGGKNQMIAKAVGLRSSEVPTVLDATAGLGRDAFVLASLGCAVTLIERVPEVRALLADALSRAANWSDANELGLASILKRMHLVQADALDYMPTLHRQDAPDVIYLDPMFPLRSKSAQVKKEMRVFHDLVGTDPDAADLLPAALACARKRVVVKRPRLASALGSVLPSYALEGKCNRYDVYTCA